MVLKAVLKWTRVLFTLWILLCPVAPLFGAWLLWRVISLPFPAHIYQKVDDLIFEFYQRMALLLAETVIGIEVVFYGDFEKVMDKKETCLLIANHQTASDWIIGNSIAERLGRLGQLRYLMKDNVQMFPVYGFYFYHHGCIYLNRKQCDFDKMRQGLNYLRSTAVQSIVFIYPEGTRFPSEKALAASNDFADKNGLRRLNYVKYPRARGMTVTIEYLRSHVDAVYDVTVVYGNTKRGKTRLNPPSLVELFTGACDSIHLHLERIPMKDVPEDEDQLKDFLYNQFYKKEKLLSQYYGEGECDTVAPFPGSPLRRKLNPVRQAIAAGMLLVFMATFNLTWVGLALSLKIWICGTLFGYAWLFVSSVS